MTEKSARIAAAHRLLRRVRRTETGEFLAEGAQAVREAVGAELDAPGTVLELYITEDAGHRNVELVRDAFARGVTVTQITERAAAALSESQSPQGIIARCRSIDASLEDVLDDDPGLVAVLVGTNDPGNAGTIIRLADAVGADAVILVGNAVDPMNPKVVRASAGSIFHLPIVRAPDALTLIEQLREAGLTTMATSGAAEIELDPADRDGMLTAPTAWIFGSEAHGLPEDVIAAADIPIRIPIHGRAESLNLATAAAVCLYASATARRR